MAIEAIKQVREVEQKAEAMVKTAHQQSKEIISKATLQGEEQNKTIVEEAKTKAQEIINKAISSGEEEAKTLLNEGAVKCESIRNLSKDKVDAAFKLVIERIVNTNGNS